MPLWGTGTGLLALMLAQRSEAEILALEIHAPSVDEARKNFASSPWANRLRLEHSDFRSWNGEGSFDLIVCNPPYFMNAKKSLKPEAAAARHQEPELLPALFRFADKNLSAKGHFAMILPFVESQKARAIAAQVGFFPSHVCTLRALPHKEVHRCMMRFGRNQVSCAETSFSVEEHRGKYSEQAFDLLKDFLLKL
jgi:tRNA1Val (adenine37-N6)-methyltransferase